MDNKRSSTKSVKKTKSQSKTRKIKETRNIKTMLDERKESHVASLISEVSNISATPETIQQMEESKGKHIQIT